MPAQVNNSLSDLVNSAGYGIVKDTTDKETFHIVGVNVELSRDELDVDASVGLDKFDQHLFRKWIIKRSDIKI